MRGLDDAVDGDVGRVDDLAHGASVARIGPLNKIRSDAVGEDRSRPAATCWSNWSANRASRCTARSRRRCATRSGPAGCRAALRCRRRARLAARARRLARGGRRGLPAARRRGLSDEPLGRLHARRDRRRSGRRPALARGRRRTPRDRLRPVPRGRLEVPARAPGCARCRRVLAEASDADFGYLSGHGMPELHAALAEYLNRVRGTSAAPDHIVICNGYAQGIALDHRRARARRARPARRRGPVRRRRRRAGRPRGRARGRRRAGRRRRHRRRRARPASTPTRSSSRRRTSGRPARCSSAARRAAACAGRSERDALIVEDDYDAEYRYDRAPIGAMQGLAPDRVIYAGTASKTLAPGPAARLARRAAAARRPRSPRPRCWPTAARRCSTSWRSPTSSPAASSTATCAACGRIYRRRRDALLAALRDRTARASSPPGSPPACTWSRSCRRRPRRDGAVTAAAARAASPSTASRPTASRTRGRPGLIFGYATLDERTIAEGIATLADAIRASRGPARRS